MTKALSGVIAPILTPFANDGSIASDLWLAHAKWVLAEGAHYLSPFGTTGEALSVSVAERRDALEALVDAGVPTETLMPGTGLCSLSETLELTRHTVELGCAGVMTLPSFFFTAATEDGHVRYFSELIEAVGSDTLKICLYNIPQNSGVPISPGLAATLNQRFPETVVAYKDSSGDWQNTLTVLEAAPQLAVFPGSESFLVQGIDHGGAGCISATCNLNPRAIRSVFESKMQDQSMTELATADDAMKGFRSAVQAAGLIGAMKAVLAVRYDDDRWLNLRAPLLNATRSEGEALLASLGSAANHIWPTTVPA